MKIALWGAATAGLAGLLQIAIFLAGMDVNIITSGAARGVILAMALVALIYLMAWDRRSVADYGLVADRRWSRHALAGLLSGLGFYAVYCLLAVLAGVFTVSTAHVSPERIGKAMLAACGAIPVAVLQQIIFSGYLPSTLRDRHSRLLAILLPAFLFGVLSATGTGEGLLSASGGGLAFGMFLIAGLLCALRLRLGNLAFPAGLLAGAIIVRRLVRKTYLLTFQPDADWTMWLAPGGDPRQAPLMWALLALALAGACYLLWRQGEYKIHANQPAIDASLKRVMPFTNLFGLAPLDLWIPLLVHARFAVGIKYVPRLVVTLVTSTVNTLLTLPERLLAPLLLKHDVPDPVFIVGVHRSGTTHLHNLLALDGRFATPRNYQVFNPHGFLTGWLTTLVLGPFLTSRRPMDAVQLHVFSPQEEEFAIAAMCRQSPYWFACFPRQYQHFARFIFPEQMTDGERRTWSRQLMLFLRKLTCWSRKTPLLKSPYNTARVAELKRLFPRAKFIHIVRHPHAVYRSNLHLAEHGWAIYQLQDADPADSYGTHFLDSYRDQETACDAALAKLPAGDVAELRFEDLEANALGQIRRLYADLRLEFTPQLEVRLEKYLANIADYKKNRFRPLPAAETAAIDAKLGAYQAKWGYNQTPAQQKAA